MKEAVVSQTNIEGILKGAHNMTKKYNKGSKNQNSAKNHGVLHGSGDNSKGNKRNKDQNDKTDLD
ncbi:hypothetical protein DOE78_21280 [Bacillus sp. Y1]|nr:hypothetical protein DOE78_21280 [Bacillus sp. Y1]